MAQPCVFLCRGCGTVLADSCSFITSEDVVGVMAFKNAHRVSVSVEKNVRSKGKDAGSVASVCSCGGCNRIVGAQYHSTPPSLDLIRGFICIEVNALDCYTLGSGDVKALDGTRQSIEGAVVQNVLGPTLTKIQQVLLSFGERLTALEEGESKKKRRK